MKKRKYIYGSFRKKIWEKYNRTCLVCKRETVLFRKQLTLFDDKRLAAIDHIKPFSKGGECVEDNFQLLCETCNSQKGNKSC